MNFGGDGLLLWAEFEGRGKLSVSCESAGPDAGAPRPPLPAAGRHAAAGHRARRPSAADHDRRGPRERRRQDHARPRRRAGPRRQRPPAPAPTRSSDDVNRAIVERRLLAIEYWTEGTDRMTDRARRAVPAGAQPRRVVLRLLVPHGRRDARVPRGDDEEREAAGRDLRAARRRGARPVPARGHPGLGRLRAQGGDRVVQPRRGPLDRRAPAGGPAARRLLPRAASPTWTSAGSPRTCSASPTRRARSSRRRPWTACATWCAACARPTRDRQARRRRRRLRRLPRGLGVLRLWPAVRHLPVVRLVRLPAHAAATCSTGWPSAFCWSLLPFAGCIVMWWLWRRASQEAGDVEGRDVSARRQVLSSPAWVWCGAATPARAPRRRLRAAGGASAARAVWTRPFARRWPLPWGRRACASWRAAPAPWSSPSPTPPGRAPANRCSRRCWTNSARPASRTARSPSPSAAACTPPPATRSAPGSPGRRSPRGSRSSTPRASSPRPPTSARPRWARRRGSPGASRRPASSITVGVVEPHLYAGFSGGVKGVSHRLRRPRDHRLDAPPGVHLEAGRHRRRVSRATPSRRPCARSPRARRSPWASTS